MPKFIAVHTLPQTEAEIMEVVKSLPQQIPAGITWKQTYCDFDEHKFFCEWEAPNKAAIEQVFKTVNMPYDAIYQVRVYDVATAKMEP